MDDRWMYVALSRHRDWPTRRPISRPTASFVLNYVVTSGLTEEDELVTLAVRAMEGWAEAFRNYDPNGQGKISCNVFHQALASLGYNMSEDDVECLLGISECLGSGTDSSRMTLLRSGTSFNKAVKGHPPKPFANPKYAGHVVLTHVAPATRQRFVEDVAGDVAVVVGVVIPEDCGPALHGSAGERDELVLFGEAPGEDVVEHEDRRQTGDGSAIRPFPALGQRGVHTASVHRQTACFSWRLYVQKEGRGEGEGGEEEGVRGISFPSLRGVVYKDDDIPNQPLDSWLFKQPYLHVRKPEKARCSTMDTRRMYAALSGRREWPTGRPVSRLTAIIVFDYVLTGGLTEEDELVALACRAMEGWAAVFRNYDPQDQGYIPCIVFHEALAACGCNVSEDFVTCALSFCERLGWVPFDKFIRACAMTATRHP
ncbi:hypothetical protein HPB50_028033 [Hyalomma asiaticum]|nr:hypothetical protein HPB50_028033 [Hyalomma asiaticum]